MDRLPRVHPLRPPPEHDPDLEVQDVEWPAVRRPERLVELLRRRAGMTLGAAIAYAARLRKGNE